VLVDQDHTAASRDLFTRLSATQSLDVKFVTSSTEQARGHIRAGRAKVAIVIPPGFGRLAGNGEEAQILALVDGTESSTGAQAVTSVQGVAVKLNTEARATSGASAATITAHIDTLFNPQRRLASFMLPGALAILLGLPYARYVAISVVIERQDGNLERLLMTPMSYLAFILGKITPWLVLGAINAALYLAAIHFGIGVPVRGSIVFVALAIVLYLLTILAMAAWVAAGSRTVGGAVDVFSYLMLPSIMISGYIFPVSSLPRLLRIAAYLLPQTHCIEIMRGICLRDASAMDLAPHLGALAVLSILMALSAAARFKRSVME
jgi:ABC-2 type transport system permease protein